MRKPRDDVDVLIVGAGPAGLSTALHLVAEDAAWAKRILVLDKARFPRPKLCGGALSPAARRMLARLGVVLKSPVRSTQTVRLKGTRHTATICFPLCIVNRQDFDAELLAFAKECGVHVSEGEALVDLHWGRENWEVQTSARSFRAKVVVGADGVQSRVRKCAGFSMQSGWPLASLLEIEVPACERARILCDENSVVVDISEMSRGLFGYSWIFPIVKQGQLHLRCGVFENFLFRSQAKWTREKPLGTILCQTLEQASLKISQNDLAGATLRSFRLKASIATHRLLLVGDAAGVDPLFGEGLSYSLQYGASAANAIAQAFGGNHFSFLGYKRSFMRSTIGWSLVLRSGVACGLAKVPWLARSGMLEPLARYGVALFPKEAKGNGN
jgi:flavin-dependent dehydrogenase